MTSFRKDVEIIRELLASANRGLIETNDVLYVDPPMKIISKKLNPNKHLKSITSDYKTKTFDKLEYHRKQYIEFICKHK